MEACVFIKANTGMEVYIFEIIKRALGAHVAQSVERILGKDEVTSSILVMGSI